MGSIPGQRHRSTIADFYAIPEEERRHELIDGEIVEKGAATGEHQGAETELAIHLGPLFGRRPGGGRPGGWWILIEPEVRFGENICRPDVAGWRREKVPACPTGTPIVAIPDWTCEILSTNKRNDLIRKKHIYHRHQVGHYWIVDPERRLLSGSRWDPAG